MRRYCLERCLSVPPEELQGDDAQAIEEDIQSKPWIELKGGYQHCWLCQAYATDGHIASEKHKRRVYWYQVQEENDRQLEPRPEWVETREGFKFCTLCRVYVTPEHLRSLRHQKNVKWHEGWKDWSDGKKEEETLPSTWGDPKYFERREGWWHCTLCSTWATEQHCLGQRHTRAVHNDEYASRGDSFQENEKRPYYSDYGSPWNGKPWKSIHSKAAAEPAISEGKRRQLDSEPWGPGWDEDSGKGQFHSDAGALCNGTTSWKAVYSEEQNRLIYLPVKIGTGTADPDAQPDIAGTGSVSSVAAEPCAEPDVQQIDDIEWC